MATVKFKCTVCEREIDVLEKPTTLNVYSKCIITEGCKGKLRKISRNQDNIREIFPKPKDGVEDYTQRAAFYKHTQNLMNTVWKVNHNLGVSPVVEVYVTNNGSLQELKITDFKVDIIDKDNITITFPNIQSGVAHCIARSSVPDYDLLPNLEDKIFKVSYNGLLVFAFPRFITHPYSGSSGGYPIDILTETKPIRIEVSIIQPNKEEVICTETIPVTINNSSPWSGWSEILLRKRRNYVIKTKSIFDFKRTFQLDTILPNDIAEGTQIRFLRIDYGSGNLQPIEQDDVLLLAANTPYQSIDKIRDKVIDCGNVLFSQFNYFRYEEGELYTSINNLESIYPLIQRIN